MPRSVTAAAGRPEPKPGSGHAGTTSTMTGIPEICRDAMKPRFERVRMPWIPGFIRLSRALLPNHLDAWRGLQQIMLAAPEHFVIADHKHTDLPLLPAGPVLAGLAHPRSLHSTPVQPGGRRSAQARPVAATELPNCYY
jgi:hypothetical protein